MHRFLKAWHILKRLPFQEQAHTARQLGASAARLMHAQLREVRCAQHDIKRGTMRSRHLRSVQKGKR
jgi:hypothetical protein